MDKIQIENIVRNVVKEYLENCPQKINRQVDKSGVIGIKGQSVQRQKLDTGNETDEVYCTDVLSLDESPRLGCGYMEVIEDKPFSWTLSYDEVDVILDGVLELITSTGKIRVEKGDTLFIPKDTSVVFTCPTGGKVRFVYTTYPADWASK